MKYAIYGMDLTGERREGRGEKPSQEELLTLTCSGALNPKPQDVRNPKP